MQHTMRKPSLYIWKKRAWKKEVQIEILYSGVCHSDIPIVKGDWGPAYPLVPGHEIVGKVTAVGSAVSKFKVGEIAGVGCLLILAELVRVVKQVMNNLWWRNDRDL
jgi:D-arabinose 1-dehydrogenase-like Zn-dependent alcohol dehydrogenase